MIVSIPDVACSQAEISFKGKFSVSNFPWWDCEQANDYVTWENAEDGKQ